MKFKVLTIVLLCLLVFSIKAQKSPSDFKVVGYYSINAALEKESKKAPFKSLTHINLWFLNPDSLGNFTRDLSALKNFIGKAHKHNVKVLFSIGGGSKQKQYHYLLKDDKRAILVKNLTAEVLKYNLDGVDIDLEGSDIDDSYEKFVVELAEEMHKHNKLITAAIAIYYKDQLSDKALAQYDFVNVMSYDRTGPWRPEKPGPHATYENAVDDLNYFYSERNIPKEKMTLGVPFYGYGFGPEVTSKAISMNYKEIVSTFPGAETLDQWTMADGKILYYNGLPTMEKKTMLAKEKASGIMIWQLLGDAKGSKSLLKRINKVAHSTK